MVFNYLLISSIEFVKAFDLLYAPPPNISYIVSEQKKRTRILFKNATDPFFF